MAHLFRNRITHEEIKLPDDVPSIDAAREEISRCLGRAGRTREEQKAARSPKNYQAPAWWKRAPEPGAWEPLGQVDGEETPGVLGVYVDPPKPAAAAK